VWVWAGEFCIKTGIFFAMMARAVDNKIFIIFEEWGRLIKDCVWERVYSGVLLSVVTRVGFCILSLDSWSFKL